MGKKLKSPCPVYGADACIYVPAGLPYRYADVSIVCGEPKFREITKGIVALENPTLLVEVLSPSTADYDRGTKFEEYKSISSFAEYLLISQDRVHTACRSRQPAGSWLARISHKGWGI